MPQWKSATREDSISAPKTLIVMSEKKAARESCDRAMSSAAQSFSSEIGDSVRRRMQRKHCLESEQEWSAPTSMCDAST
jgi:hypothetical protein